MDKPLIAQNVEKALKLWDLLKSESDWDRGEIIYFMQTFHQVNVERLKRNASKATTP